MKTSLLIPIYNEAAHAEEFFKAVDALRLPTDKELVIVDDCSTDGTSKIIDAFKFNSQVVIVHHPVNKGKGSALQTAIAHATGEIIGVQDADFEYDMADLEGLIAPIAEGRADVVYGSRFKSSGQQVHRTFHYLINRVLTLLSNICTGLYLTDMETCYKFFRREIILSIKLDSQRFGFEPEITAKIAKLKLRILEIPIRYYPRNYLQGKKINWRDGVAALRHIIYYSMVVKPKTYLKPELPKKFLPQGGNWL